MPEKRADTLLRTMQNIERFTLRRAWDGLTDDELRWEPAAGSWGVRSRALCQSPTPFGAGDWVVDFDAGLVMAAIRGEAVEPLTTIGWLLWHVGSLPGRLTQLDFFGGVQTMASGWTSPYLTDHQVFTDAAGAVETMRAGWQRLAAALETATDEALERPTRDYSYSSEPGPVTYGSAIVAGALSEISHHGSQLCTLRDLYRLTNGRTFAVE